MLYQPSPVIFAEGLQLFADERIRELFPLRLWLEVPEDVALARRLQRQPDYDVEYHRTVALPAQRALVLPLKIHAHETIDGTRSIREVAEQTDGIIYRFLGK